MARLRRKLGWGLAWALSFFLLAYAAPRHDPAFLTSLGLLVAVAYLFLAQACRLGRPLVPGFVLWLVAAVRAIRTFVAVPPEIQMLHVAAWSCALFGVAFGLAGFGAAGSIASFGFIGLLFIAGVVDLLQRIGPLVRAVWHDVLGKVFAVSIGAALVGLAVALAKRWIHSVVHIDPKYLSEALAIVSALLLPIVYTAFGMAILFAFAVAQFIGLAAFSLLASTTPSLFGPTIGQAIRARWKRFWEATAPENACAAKEDKTVLSRLLSDLSHYSRPFSTLAIVFGFAGGLGFLLGGLAQLQPRLTTELVRLEYRVDSSCRGLKDAAGVVYMDDGNVSVARRKEDGFSFSVEKCNFDADDGQ